MIDDPSRNSEKQEIAATIEQVAEGE